MKFSRQIMIPVLMSAMAAILPVKTFSQQEQSDEHKPIKVVTTLTVYADMARRVGGERVEVVSLVGGDQDPHYVRPRPSLAETLAKAELFISTGLDLELWVPGLVDLSRNTEIRSGQRRYVSAAHGIDLLEKPTVISQSEGHVHIYGNPHFQLSPMALRQVARNIAAGLSNIDPAGASFYTANAEKVREQLIEALAGPELVSMLGQDTLVRLLANPDRMIDFLKNRNFQGEPMINKLGGWMEKAMPLRGAKVIAYHKNWSYFSKLFGIDVVNYIEPRPGVPPRADHVASVIDQMRNENIRIIIAANYYDEGHVRDIASRVNAICVIVPLYPEGVKGVDTYEKLMEHIIDSFLDGFEKAAKGSSN